MMKPGLRVVRGPNWSWGNQDGGEGYVGTVTQIGTTESDRTVVVQWDNGSRSICRVGYLDKYDLRVIDNAQIGVQHHRISCDGCDAKRISGIRYKCLHCYDYDLCYICYHGGKHDLTHSFKIFETENSSGFNLPPRFNERMTILKGIFVGATVMRGFDWEWDNQDGGEGKHGTVMDIRGIDRKNYRSTVCVKWHEANTEIYRLGHRGLCDVQFVEAAVGGYYYTTHLPILGQSEEQMEFNLIVENIELQQVVESISKEEDDSSLYGIHYSERYERSTMVKEDNESVWEKCPSLSPGLTRYLSLTDLDDSTLSQVGVIPFATIIKHYVTDALTRLGGKEELPDLVNEYAAASCKSFDEDVKEMWQVLNYMTVSTSVPDREVRDVLEVRNSLSSIDRFVRRGKKFLEMRYSQYIFYVVNGKLSKSQVYMTDDENLNLVPNFIKMRFPIFEYEGLDNEMVYDCPLWARVYYSMRVGDFRTASKCLRLVKRPEYEKLVLLLDFYLDKGCTEMDLYILREAIGSSYKLSVKNSTDPFKRIVWAILGGIDEMSEVIRNVEDYLWFKLSLLPLYEIKDKDVDFYIDLKRNLLEGKTEPRYDTVKHPVVFFKILTLTGQFEVAIDFLFRIDRFKADAAHMAVALYEANMLACPQDTNSPLLSLSPSDCSPAYRLNFALLLKNYVSKFEPSCLEQILNYLYLLGSIRNEEGKNLFWINVADLILRTKEYKQILGTMCEGGAREQGLLARFNVDCQKFTDKLAQGLVSKDQYEEALELYEGVNDQNGVLTVMCNVLAKVAHLENDPDSLRNNFQAKANILNERFVKDGFCSTRINIINSFIKLRGLLVFFDLYREHKYQEALKALIELRLVPLRGVEIEEAVKNFEGISEDVSKVMPYVLLATMTILRVQCDRIKCTDGPMEQHLVCVWEQANCVANFAERLANVLPIDMNKLTEMEVLMHS